MKKNDYEFVEKYKKKYRIKYDMGIESDGREVRIAPYLKCNGKDNKDTGQVYQVYEYSDKKLAAIVPPARGAMLLKDFDMFDLVVDANDCKVIVFDEDKLDVVKKRLKLSKRKQISEEERLILAERLKPYYYEKI